MDFYIVRLSVQWYLLYVCAIIIRRQFFVYTNHQQPQTLNSQDTVEKLLILLRYRLLWNRRLTAHSCMHVFIVFAWLHTSVRHNAIGKCSNRFAGKIFKFKKRS